MESGFTQQLQAARQRLETKRQRSQFVKGPIPLTWLTRAFQLGGKCGAMAVALAWRAGLTGGTHDLSVTNATAMRFGIATRNSRRSTLRRLEEAGLVRVDRYPNKAPRVELLVYE